MSRHQYYEEMKALAREKRMQLEVVTAAFGLREVRKIYKTEGIRIHRYPLPYKIKALYMCADNYCSVAIQQKLPDEPKLFALVHELKHHYCDRQALGDGVIHCGDYNMDDLVEKSAEVFAAEFIYPENEFSADLTDQSIVSWTAEDIVNLKRNCKARVSYRFICKRLERLGLIARGVFDSVRFQKLEDEMFGVPFYRRRAAA